MSLKHFYDSFPSNWFLARLLNMVSLQDNTCPYIFLLYSPTYFFDIWKSLTIFFANANLLLLSKSVSRCRRNVPSWLITLYCIQKCCPCFGALRKQNFRDQETWMFSSVINQSSADVIMCLKSLRDIKYSIGLYFLKLVKEKR